MAGEAKERVVGGMLYQCGVNVKNTRKSEGYERMRELRKGPNIAARTDRLVTLPLRMKKR